MAASGSDYFKKLGGASSLVNSPKTTATRAALGTTLTVDNCNWDTTTGKVFATYQVNTSNTVVAGTEIIWTGIVTGTTSIGSLVRIAGAADTGNAIGDIVELLPASKWANDLMTGLLVEHSQTGVHALTANSTLTSSKHITDISDTNGNELLKLTATASAVNELTLANAATGNNPTLTASGGDTNITMRLQGKGTPGNVWIDEYQPYKFFAYRNAAANTGSLAFAKITFDTEDYDTNNNFATGTYTAPVAGFYQFNTTVTSTAGTFLIIALYKNGAEYLDGGHISTAGGVSLSTVIQLAASDTVEIWSQANGAAALQVGTPRATYFSGFLVSRT